MKYPVLPLEVAVEPRRSEDRDQLRKALDALTAQSHDIAYAIDWESGQIILKGLDELELETLVLRLEGEFGVEMNVGAPQVSYRETISRTVESDYTYKRRNPDHFARVKIRFEPAPNQDEMAFVSQAAADVLPEDLIRGVERGIRTASESGMVAGFPIIGATAILLDAAYHPIDSNPGTFDTAARACLREALRKAGSRIMEPMMEVEVITPEDHLGDVVGDLNSRRGMVVGMDSGEGQFMVGAVVPLSNMFGYVNTLRSMTDRRATFTMRFLRYEAVPIRPPDDDFPAAMALRP